MHARSCRAWIVLHGAVAAIVTRRAITGIRADKINALTATQTWILSAIIDVYGAVGSGVAWQAQTLECVDLWLDAGGSVLTRVGGACVEDGLAVATCVAWEAGT